MKEQKHSMEIIFTMITFLIYAAALLLFVSLGASVYQSVTEGMEQHQIGRTAENYLREKIRQNDREGAVSITEIQGQQALKIVVQIGDKEYHTYIYAEEGMLKELLIDSEKEVRLNEGTKLVEMKDLKLEEQKDGSLGIKMELQKGQTQTFVIRMKGGNV